MGTFKHPIRGRVQHSTMNSGCHMQTFAANAHIRSGWRQAAAMLFLFSEVTNTKLISGVIPSNAKFNSLIATQLFIYLFSQVSSCLCYLFFCTKGRICELWPHRGAVQLFLMWKSYSPPLQCPAGIWIRKMFGRILCRKSGKCKVDCDDERGR